MSAISKRGFVAYTKIQILVLIIGIICAFFNNSNLEFIFNSPDFRIKITTNPQWFRDDEESLVNPAILFLGDSFGFGWGVEGNKTCASFLEELTGKSVLNMCVSGFGTIQEVLLL